VVIVRRAATTIMARAFFIDGSSFGVHLSALQV
jgi:hypothetical protein